MSLLDDIRAKADQNGDGKLSLDDLEALRSGDNGNVIDRLKESVTGKDGKLDFNDIKNLNLDELKNDASSILNQAKDSLGGFFNKK